MSLTTLGVILRAQGRIDEARDTLGSAVEIARGAGARRSEANARGNLGNVYLSRYELREAREQYERVHEIGREILTLAQRRFDTRILHESCTGAQTTFENRYWLDRRGKIRASEQWMGPGERFFRLELVTL